ncbi:hypothetical protein KQX54_010590 [Cotesia glomerata]|uniref:Uncharacterized protein n=1 Tax=Cotesia glomerata TaxID=32391 RepID=A0AAV7HVY9_COTGL|nr:hypothetical protein KQX54_010590 [Cotesia glomerata]
MIQDNFIDTARLAKSITVQWILWLQLVLSTWENQLKEYEVYPFSSENPPLRDHEMYLTDVEQLKKDLETLPKTKKNEKYTVFGVKGSSVLSNLPDFDCIWGFPHLYAWGIIRS